MNKRTNASDIKTQGGLLLLVKHNLLVASSLIVEKDLRIILNIFITLYHLSKQEHKQEGKIS